MNNSIGRIIEVSPSYIRVEISNLLFLSYNLAGRTYDSKGINEYISIDGKYGETFIYQTIRAEDDEKSLSHDENSKFSNSGIITCIPIGIFKERRIEFNFYYYPFLNDEVYLTTQQQLYGIFSSNTNHKNLHLGSTVEGLIPNINFESYITRHTAILGNTGSGKSTTVRKSIEEIYKLKPDNLCFHILDIHGEYEPSNLISYKKFNVAEEYRILIKSLNLNDWTNLFRPSEQVQLPILQLALKISSLISNYPWFRPWINLFLSYSLYNKVQTDVVGKRAKIGRLISEYENLMKVFCAQPYTRTTYDKNINNLLSDMLNYNIQYGNWKTNAEEQQFLNNLRNGMSLLWEYSGNDPEASFNSLLNAANYCVDSFEDLYIALELAYLLEESKGNSQARSYSASLETRIKTVAVRFNSIFTSDVSSLPKSISSKFIIYNVESLEDDLILFFSSYILNKTFETQRKIAPEDRDIHVFLLEEAHRYISKNLENTSNQQINIFKKIAREGRKFGCFLQISSQRPSELSATVLSQCNNFVIHRIKNNIDLDYMSSTIPYLTKNQLDRVSYLPTGTALLVGDFFPIPLEISVSSSNLFRDTTPPILRYISG